MGAAEVRLMPGCACGCPVCTVGCATLVAMRDRLRGLLEAEIRAQSGRLPKDRGDRGRSLRSQLAAIELEFQRFRLAMHPREPRPAGYGTYLAAHLH